jgi:glycerophosphoryl diester phosphodiesterase
MNLIAHRGGAGLRVENTLAAFENAIELGADGAELDVNLTRDGQVVVHHDDVLNGAYCRRDDGTWPSCGATTSARPGREVTTQFVSIASWRSPTSESRSCAK